MNGFIHDNTLSKTMTPDGSNWSNPMNISYVDEFIIDISSFSCFYLVLNSDI